MDRAEGGVYALGQEFAQTLTEYLHSLPRPERFAVASAQRTEDWQTRAMRICAPSARCAS